ncbi:MAG: LacI family DNA-binding transcriptional regulator [Paracoccaceae bacterium]
METEKRAKIQDVAALAGVSVGTVSRVLAGHPAVKHGPLLRVKAAIEELGYRPNLVARALRSNRINVIGLLIPDILNPYFAQLANDLERIAADAGYALILSSSHNDPKREARQLVAVLEQKPVAIIFVPTSGKLAADVPAPTRALSIDRPADGYAAITVDQQQGAAVALDHLVELGHRRIAYLAGPDNNTNARERLDGFLSRAAVVSAAGIALSIDVYPGDFDFQSGEHIARALLQKQKAERVTAIAAASDQQAIGAIRAARDLGLVVPTDLSVIGFDDITLANLIVPRLTTIQQPVGDMAETAIRAVLAFNTSLTSQEFLARLIVRDSTAECPENDPSRAH